MARFNPIVDGIRQSVDAWIHKISLFNWIWHRFTLAYFVTDIQRWRNVMDKRSPEIDERNVSVQERGIILFCYV